ncbi:MAG: ADP-ribosylglycohydrolase family protein [Phycisphaerae bacterium]|nr:ADP-ribosylglycohydrolase family protein [Phycisphaerae bacterium]
MTLAEKIDGALLGAVIGSELAFGRLVRIHADFATAWNLPPLETELTRNTTWKPIPTNQWWAKLTGLLQLGVNAYTRAGGRATPEDFAAELTRDKTALTPAFPLDGLHTTQELLREGMNPRITGMNTAPCGIIAAVMPVVGIFHFADPSRAFFDGIELASVAQPRVGADWAATCAALVAAAFAANTPQELYAPVQAILREEAKPLALEYNRLLWGLPIRDEAAFITQYQQTAAVTPTEATQQWLDANPARAALPALYNFHDQPRKLMAAIINTRHHGMPGEGGWTGAHCVAAMTAGAAAGAMHGPKIFPAEWLAWARAIVKPMLAIVPIVQARVAEERDILRSVQTLAAPRKNGESKLHDKIKGALLAGAIGNAMGSPVEGSMWYDIDKRFPNHVLTVLDPSKLESEDDNQMAMLLVETYIERQGAPVMARHFGQTWRRRLNRDHFFPLCMGNSYDLIMAGQDPRITGHWNIVTGSTVMCLEPAGMYNVADPAWAAQDAVAISYMYQRGLDVVAAGMLAATTAAALRHDATVDGVLQAALDAAPTTPLKTFDRRKFKSARHYIETCLKVADKYDDVLAARAELYDKCLLYHAIDPLELWGLALAMFKIADGDVRQAAIGGTNIGRDSDTIAGRGAMLAGALRGGANVPREWVAMFSPASMARIDANAAALTDLVANKKPAAMRRRQELA